MQVRRTGARKGCSPIFYIQADEETEQEAMRYGLLPEEWCGLRYPWVLAWGYGSKADAERAMTRLMPMVTEEAVERVEGLRQHTTRRGRPAGPSTGPGVDSDGAIGGGRRVGRLERQEGRRGAGRGEDVGMDMGLENWCFWRLLRRREGVGVWE